MTIGPITIDDPDMGGHQLALIEGPNGSHTGYAAELIKIGSREAMVIGEAAAFAKIAVQGTPGVEIVGKGDDFGLAALNGAADFAAVMFGNFKLGLPIHELWVL